MNQMESIDILETDPIVTTDTDSTDVDPADLLAQKPQFITNVKCHNHDTPVNIPVSSLSADQSGKMFIAPCPECGYTVRIVDSVVRDALGLSKSDTIQLRNALVTRQTGNRISVGSDDASGAHAEYNPQEFDHHAYVEKVEPVYKIDIVGVPDSGTDDNGDEKPQIPTQGEPMKSIKSRDILLTDTGSVPDVPADVDEFDDDEDDIGTDVVIPTRNRRVISPVNGTKVTQSERKPSRAKQRDTGDDDMETDNESIGVAFDDEEIEPNDLLKRTIMEWSIDERLKKHIIEDITLEPNGLQPNAVMILLQSYGISNQTSTKIARYYEALLAKENKKRLAREQRQSIVGRPSGNVSLYPGAMSGYYGIPMTTPMMPVASAPMNTLMQQIGGLVQNSAGNMVTMYMANQLQMLANQMTQLSNSPTVTPDVQQTIMQLYPLIYQMVAKLEQYNVSAQQMNPQDMMMITQSMQQIQQSLNDLSVKVQTRSVPTRRRIPSVSRPFDDDDDDDDDYDRSRSRYDVLRRRSLFARSAPDESSVKNEIKEIKDTFASFMNTMMMQQQMQQHHQPAAANPVTAELKQMRDAIIELAREREERERDASLEEIREMKEFMMNFLQQQQQTKKESETQELKAMIADFMKMQSQQPSTRTSDDSTAQVYGLLIEMIRQQNAKPSGGDDLKEMRQFMFDLMKQQASSRDDKSPRDSQQVLVDKLLSYALEDKKKANPYDPMMLQLLTEIQELKKTNLPPTGVSVEELKHNLEIQKLQTEAELQKREIADKQESRQFYKSMLDNSFRQIGETVGALLTSGMMGGGAGASAQPAVQNVQPFVNDDGLMAFQCPTCSGAIYVPYGVTNVVCPSCNAHYVLDAMGGGAASAGMPSTAAMPPVAAPPVDVSPVARQRPAVPETVSSGPKPGAKPTPTGRYASSAGMWDVTRMAPKPRPQQTIEQVDVDTSSVRNAVPKVDHRKSPVIDTSVFASSASAPVIPPMEIQPRSTVVDVRKVSDLPPPVTPAAPVDVPQTDGESGNADPAPEPSPVKTKRNTRSTKKTAVKSSESSVTDDKGVDNT